MTEELFDCRMRLPHVHRATSFLQDLNDGPLDHAIADTTRV